MCVSSVRFADDVLLFSENVNEIVKMINEPNKEMGRLVSRKTNIMFNTAPLTEDVILRDWQLVKGVGKIITNNGATVCWKDE